VRSTAKASSINNKNWDDILARFDIQNQCDADLLPEQGATTHTFVEAHSSLMLSWTTRVILLVGCVVALGNLPLQSYFPNNSNGQFTLTPDNQLATPASHTVFGSSEMTVPPSERTNYTSISKSLIPTAVVEAATTLNNEETQELALPKQPLATYSGHKLINTGSIWQTYTVKRYDNQTNIFSRIKQSGILQDLQQIKSIKGALDKIKMDTVVRAKSYKGQLEQLVFTPDYENSFVITPTESGSFEGAWQKEQFEVRQARGIFSIKNGLFSDAKKVGVPENILSQVVTVFDWDIDFSKDVKVGDQVTIVFESIYHEGDLVGSLKLLAAEFINGDDRYRTIRHTTARGLTDYFTPEGREMKRAFIRTPVMRARVSSHFNPKRLHPILNKLRAHKGTDFAAPRGTPIIATGDGRVKLIGKKGGYGKTIVLRHREGYTTLYSHLSKFKKDLKKGQVVAQGDVIGYVGSTGLATGPNLHYEFRKNNTPANPLTVKLPNSLSLTKKELASFKVDAINMKLQLNVLHRFAKEDVDIASAIGG
jgi:murein DD-endopeptidase MepM/ murein hydrolase activator NlpD